MTDRVNSLQVCLDKDYRDDDIEVLRTAIMQMRGVISVGLNISDGDTWMAETRARQELGKKILDIVYPKPIEQ